MLDYFERKLKRNWRGHKSVIVINTFNFLLFSSHCSCQWSLPKPLLTLVIVTWLVESRKCYFSNTACNLAKQMLQPGLCHTPNHTQNCITIMLSPQRKCDNQTKTELNVNYNNHSETFTMQRNINFEGWEAG